jgi:hypothetical protein
LSEVESMVPWEREIYIDLLITHLKEEKQKQDERNRTNK